MLILLETFSKKAWEMVGAQDPEQANAAVRNRAQGLTSSPRSGNGQTTWLTKDTLSGYWLRCCWKYFSPDDFGWTMWSDKNFPRHE